MNEVKKILNLIFNRYIFVIDGVIIIVFAAFIAASIDEIIAAKIDGIILNYNTSRRSEKLKNKDSHLLVSSMRSFKPVDGKAILHRNIFDSSTGPLDEPAINAAVFLPENLYPEEENDGTLPPRCEAGFSLVGLFASPDPQWSFAAIKDGQKIQILQIGQNIMGYLVEDITWKYLFLSPSQSSSRCYLDIWSPTTTPSKSTAATRRKSKPVPPKRSPTSSIKRESEKNPIQQRIQFKKMLDSSIQSISPTEKNVDKQLVDYLLNNKHLLMQSGRVLPNIENSEINGFKIYGIRKTSLWGRLGLENGDVVRSINGITFKGPESAYEALSKLRDADHLTITVTRRGKDMNLDINLK